MTRDSEAAAAPPGQVCPACGGASTPIVYGYPSHETFEAAERGEVVIGGCMVWDGQPTRRCSHCGAASGGPGGSREDV